MFCTNCTFQIEKVFSANKIHFLKWTQFLSFERSLGVRESEREEVFQSNSSQGDLLIKMKFIWWNSNFSLLLFPHCNFPFFKLGSSRSLRELFFFLLSYCILCPLTGQLFKTINKTKVDSILSTARNVVQFLN